MAAALFRADYDGALAPYATRGAQSRGRLHAEADAGLPEDLFRLPETRNPFQRDRDRILHSGAFRKLMHKTQVFILASGDYYRTRLSHTIEVAQIARTLARALGAHEDLTEALALAHDLGHTPFGHSGEEALAALLAGHGGFDHNDQTVRILTRLETRYATFDGLNLTWETIEGAAKHNGPLQPPPGSAAARVAGPRPLPVTIDRLNRRWDLDLGRWSSLEAQIAAISDDIAYNSADLEDGLRARLFTVDDLAELPILGAIVRQVLNLHGKLEIRRLTNEVRRRLIATSVRQVLSETERRLTAAGIASPEDVRNHPGPLVALDEEVQAQDREVRRFLWDNMYLHHSVVRRKLQARRIVSDLFAIFAAEAEALPRRWQQRLRAASAEGEAARLRVVADYIAGMTDRYAVATHKHLFNYYEGSP